MISIVFNGKNIEVEEGTSLQAFTGKYLKEDKFAIEVDLEVVPKSLYHEFILKDGMKIEAITFVGGG